MNIHLKRFSASELLLSQERAWRVLRFFFPGINVPPGSITDDDRNFAQGLLVEAIDRSYAMGYVERLFSSFFMKVPASFGDVAGLLKDFGKAALKHWFQHATGQDLRDPKVYESIQLTMRRSFRSTWSIREQSGELTY
jgi:hypothetical protein